jgi:hypothetical protein
MPGNTFRTLSVVAARHRKRAIVCSYSSAVETENREIVSMLLLARGCVRHSVQMN